MSVVNIWTYAKDGNVNVLRVHVTSMSGGYVIRAVMTTVERMAHHYGTIRTSHEVTYEWVR